MPVRETLPRRRLRELCAYAAVGVVATAIQYAVLLVAVQGLHLRPVPASSAGFVISAAVNYLLNYHLTFRSHAPQLRAASRFAFVALTGLALNAIVMAVLTSPLHLPYLLAQLIATAAVFVWTYLANSRWSFVSGETRRRRGAPLALPAAGGSREEYP